MQGCSASKAQDDKLKRFWDFKAKRYPLPFDEKSLATAIKVIEIVKGRGVDITNARILDIGCGTGNYTLPLAREAGSVTGIDFSDAMISRLRDELERYCIQNVSAFCIDWKKADIASLSFEKAFDIVWSAMSMAVRDVDDLKKMEACSKRWCVYIGWGSVRKNFLMEGIFNSHNMPFAPPPGAIKVSSNLKDMGRTHSFDFINTSWDWSGTLDEAVEDIAMHIDVFGGNPKTEVIKDALLRHIKDGMVRHTTHAEIGIVVWQIV